MAPAPSATPTRSRTARRAWPWTLGRIAFLGAVLAAPVAGCGDDDTTQPAAAGGQPVAATDEAAPRDRNAPSPETLAAVRDGDVAALLQVLAQPHATARAVLGPHTLRWTASFKQAGTSARAELPPLDAPVVDDRAIEDEGTLRWASAAGEAPRWALSQQNDHERGRDVVALGERMSVRQRHRKWVEQPYEPAVVELWLDDAQQVAYDAVEFAAPRAAISVETKDGGGIGDNVALVLTLSLADAEQTIAGERPSSQGVRRGWRDQAELTSVSGTVTLDGATGLWLGADLDVQYALSGADERRLVGSLSLRAAVEPGPPEPFGAPTDPEPMPTLPRYAVEQQALLEGL